jgi:hypothetical protein
MTNSKGAIRDLGLPCTPERGAESKIGQGDSLVGDRVGSAPVDRATVRPNAALVTASAAITLLVLAPVFRPGFVLVYDMVFTPEQPLLPESLGLGSALPRAVPVDGVVAVLTSVVPGELLQKAALAGAIFAAALGAGRLVPTTSTATRVVAATAYAWNAYVAERLFLGHWSLLVAYACLPWVVAAGLRLRRGEPGAWAALVLACAPAALVPTGGLLAAGAAVAAAGVRRMPATLALAAALNAPWWLPSLLHGGGTSDPAAVAAFAARAEGPGGVVASALGLGGIWNGDVVPASRAGVLVPLVAALLLVGTAFGARRLAAAWGAAPVLALGGLAAAGVVIAVAASVPGLGAAVRWLVAEVPGAGLLRDGQKWIAWWALFATLACALAVDAAATALGRRLREPAAAAAVFAGAVLLPILLLPDLAWGGLGRLTPVQYPRDWYAVRALLVADRGPGDVLVLPFQSFRRFGWNAGRTQLDPAPRFLPRSAVVDDTLVVGDRPLRGEDPRAARIRATIGRGGGAVGGDGGAPGALARDGIGWVLVEHGTPGDVDPALLADLTVVHSGPWLTLYRVPGAVARPPSPGTAARAAVLVTDIAVVLLLALALLRRRLPAGTFSPIADRDANQEETSSARARSHSRRWPRGHRPGGRGDIHDRADQRPRQGGRAADRD